MKTLFVDDEKWRFDNMLRWGFLPNDAVWAATATDAINEIVDNGPFGIIFLDHDLNTFVSDPYPREVTGRDVARVLSAQEWSPDFVVVHSANPVGASNIANVLRDADISVIVKSITSFADDAHRG